VLVWQPAAAYGTDRFEAHASMAGTARLLMPHRDAAHQADSSAPGGAGDASALDGAVGTLQRAWCSAQARAEAPDLAAADPAEFEARVDAVERATTLVCVLQVREAAAEAVAPTAQKRTRAPRRKAAKKEGE
jgi:hypothetical protein